MSEPQNEIEVFQLITGDDLVLKSTLIPDLLAHERAEKQFNADIHVLKDIAFPEPIIRINQHYLELVISTDLLFKYAGCQNIIKQNIFCSSKRYDKIILPIQLDYQLYRVWSEAELHEYDRDLMRYVFYDNESNLQTLHDRRSRLLHRYIADMILTNPDLLALAKIRAKDQIARGQPENSKDPLREWQGIFNTLPQDEILNFIISNSEKADQLRQSSPFISCLNIGQRRRLNLAFWRIFKSLKK